MAGTNGMRFLSEHKSPQMLLVHDGSARWTASHFGVTADAIRVALASVENAAVA